jgi:hypothetical protein
MVVLAAPLFMMNGAVRPVIGAGFLAIGGYMLWRSARRTDESPGANGIESRRE